ncbi:hypothetical protein, partial [Streptomyces sp. NPDC058401]|uniref:hypothetical protein n=1 Tax=Streptomyces sp. NPDC058401 TaxID=3346480 RepID=UPI00365180DA
MREALTKSSSARNLWRHGRITAIRSLKKLITMRKIAAGAVAPGRVPSWNRGQHEMEAKRPVDG